MLTIQSESEIEASEMLQHGVLNSIVYVLGLSDAPAWCGTSCSSFR